ncbi:MAG: hypothetical protein J6S67_03530 [Methanobrevibacter sp.]|nr:hypothetical protein [Methanobrevibacter sp.]
MENKELFENIAKLAIKREGIQDLLTALELTDFYDAPASTKYHLSIYGGLCQHSLDVYYAMINSLPHTIYNKDFMNKYSLESRAIVSLFHDVCKANVYFPSIRNVKKYDFDREKYELNAYMQSMIKQDAIGEFVWEQEQTFTFDDSFPLGHGEKSLYLISKYIDLTEDEAIAIRYHMGAFRNEDIQNLNKVYSKYPLALALHISDMIATYIIEE